ncbi:unnamed protein product [Closterium sp. Yama58-4]|nr:unnamed protein product [Closterium sp. Yama58-4]
MDSESPPRSGASHGRLGAQQALSGGGERVVSLMVGPDRTQFLCNASLLSRHSPFLASLLSDRWSTAAPRTCADDAEGVAREGEGRGDIRGGASADSSWELASVDARDFAHVMLLLAYKQLQSQPDLGNEELDSLRGTLDFLKVDIHTLNAHAARDLSNMGGVSSSSANAAAGNASLTSFSCPPLVRQLQPLPVVRVPPGCDDPLLFEQPDEFSKFRLNLRHHAILCTICWASGQGLRSGNICGHGHLWALVDRTQRKVVQPDLCTTRLCLYAKLPMDTVGSSLSDAGHGRLGAVNVGGERVVSLLVGPERTQFLCNASLLSRHSPFLASLLSNRWSSAAPRTRADDAEERDKGRKNISVDTFELKSVDAKDFSRVLLLLAHKQLQSHPKLSNDDLASLTSTLDFLKSELDTRVRLTNGNASGKAGKAGDTSRSGVAAATTRTSFSFVACPPLVRQLRPVPAVPVPPGFQDPLLFETDGYPSVRLNLLHHAIWCSACDVSMLLNGGLCCDVHLWDLVDQVQEKAVQPDLCTARLRLYTKVRAMYDDPKSGAVQIRRTEETTHAQSEEFLDPLGESSAMARMRPSGSVLFAVVGRTQYAFDAYSAALPPHFFRHPPAQSPFWSAHTPAAAVGAESTEKIKGGAHNRTGVGCPARRGSGGQEGLAEGGNEALVGCENGGGKRTGRGTISERRHTATSGSASHSAQFTVGLRSKRDGTGVEVAREEAGGGRGGKLTGGDGAEGRGSNDLGLVFVSEAEGGAGNVMFCELAQGAEYRVAGEEVVAKVTGGGRMKETKSRAAGREVAEGEDGAGLLKGVQAMQAQWGRLALGQAKQQGGAKGKERRMLAGDGGDGGEEDQGAVLRACQGRRSKQRQGGEGAEGREGGDGGDGGVGEVEVQGSGRSEGVCEAVQLTQGVAWHDRPAMVAAAGGPYLVFARTQPGHSAAPGGMAGAWAGGQAEGGASGKGHAARLSWSAVHVQHMGSNGTTTAKICTCCVSPSPYTKVFLAHCFSPPTPSPSLLDPPQHCVTPPHLADFSPSVSPSGRWLAVASAPARYSSHHTHASAAAASTADMGTGGAVGMQQRDLLALPTAIHVMRLPDGKHRQEVVAQGGWPAWGKDDSSLLFHRLVRSRGEAGRDSAEGVQQGEGSEGWFGVFQVQLNLPGEDEGQARQRADGEEEDGFSGTASTAQTDVGATAVASAGVSPGEGKAWIGVGREERLTPPGLHALTPSSAASSPCGPFIALTTRRPPSPFRHVELLHLPSRQLYMLTQHIRPSANHYTPSVAPDGSRVAYHRCRCAGADGEDEGDLADDSAPVAEGSEGTGSKKDTAGAHNEEAHRALLAQPPLTLSQPISPQRAHADCTDCHGYYMEPIATPLPPSTPFTLIRTAGLFPALSPDGRLLAFIRALSGPSAGVYVVPADGSAVQQQVFQGAAFGLAWNPTVPGVLYTSVGQGFAPGEAEVHVMEVSGVGAWLFQEGGGREGKAEGGAGGGAEGDREEEDSGGGDRSSRTGRGRVNGVSWRRLTLPGTRNNAFPAPSPCGRWIVFRSARTGHKNLFLMPAQHGERGGVWQVSDGPWTDTMPAWDPWGRWIVFSSDRGESEGFALYAMPAVLPTSAVASGAASGGGGDTRSAGKVEQEKQWQQAAEQQQGVVRVWHNGPWGRVNHAAFSQDGHFLVVTADMAGMSADPVAYPQQFQPYGEIFLLQLNRTKHPPQAAAGNERRGDYVAGDASSGSSSGGGSAVEGELGEEQLNVRQWERLTFNPYEDGTPSWSPHIVHPAPLHTQRHRVTCDFDDVGALAGRVRVED